jgi:hypothetical protein
MYAAEDGGEAFEGVDKAADGAEDEGALGRAEGGGTHVVGRYTIGNQTSSKTKYMLA